LGWRRDATASAISKLFPYEVTENSFPLDDIRTYAEDGYGIIMVYNHLTKSDHVRAAAVIVDEVEAVKTRRIASPIALHQVKMLAKLLGRVGKVELLPVVTNDTREKFKEEGKKLPPLREQAKMAKDYMQSGVEVLREGGVLAVAPQIGRRSALGEPEGKVIERFLSEFDDGRIVFLFVGLGITGVRDYSEEGIDGYNVRKHYSVTFGRPMTRVELEITANDSRTTVDNIVFKELAKVVPPEYASAGRASQT